MNSLMLVRIGLSILLGSVAILAYVYYIANKQINLAIERALLEKCFRSNYANDNRKNSN